MQVGARGTSVRFETDRPGQPTARMPQWERWRDLPLTPEQDQALDEYLRQRATTPFDNRGEAWQVPRADPDEVRRLIGLPAEPAGRVFAMFPNLGFDAGKTSTVSAFDSAIDWILETMAFFAARSARDSVLALLAQRYPTLPPNVHLIESGAGVSAHTVVRLADVALGRPVVLVGGGWNARRGFTLDVSTPAEYLEVLARLAAGEGPDPAPVALARRYAYSLFFRATIPISHVSVFDLDVASINLEGLEALAPGLRRASIRRWTRSAGAFFGTSRSRTRASLREAVRFPEHGDHAVLRPCGRVPCHHPGRNVPADRHQLWPSLRSRRRPAAAVRVITVPRLWRSQRGPCTGPLPPVPPRVLRRLLLSPAVPVSRVPPVDLADVGGFQTSLLD
jgi:hypothetical protein